MQDPCCFDECAASPNDAHALTPRGRTDGAPRVATADVPSTRRRGSRLGWASVALSLVLLGASVQLADSREVLQRLEGVDARWLVPAFALGLVQLSLLGLRWSRLATELGLRLGWRKATSEYALSVLGNQVLPTGVAGDGIRGLRHTRYAGDGGPKLVFEALALDRISGQLALWLMVLLTAPLTVSAGLVHVRSLAVAGAVLAGGALGVWALLGASPWLRGPAARARAVLRRAALLLLSPRGMGVHLPLSLLLVVSTLLQVYVAARAIGVVLPLLQLLWLGPLMLVAASVPSFFGGWGVREGASALLFAAAGMPQSMGVAVSMIYGSFALVISLPGVIVLVFDAKRTKAARPAPAR